jgi:signal transduction histidine kinase
MAQILIVDDVPENLKALASILQDRGYAVRVANSGQQALNAVAREAPDLILLDILMPGVNGYDVCRQLKALPAFEAIPVIFVSALDEMLDKVQAFEAGGVDYIVKPFQAEEVLIRVETQLKLRQLQQRLVEQIETKEQINQQLVEANERLENLVHEREELLGILAHDLKNILTVIALKLSILKKLYPALTAEQFTGYLNEIKSAKDHMASIITRLLDVAQLDDSLDVEIRRILLEPSIKRVLEQYTSLAAEKHIELRYEASPEDFQVRADPALLEEVLANLISNAIKYSPRNTQVTVRLLRIEAWAAIEIEDKGLGLSAEDHGKLFKKFTRLSAKPTGGEESLGLGLYIVKKLMDAMGGTIAARSPGINQGSTFALHLPLGGGESPDDA